MYLVVFGLITIGVLIYVGLTMGPSGKTYKNKNDNGDLEESFVNNMRYNVNRTLSGIKLF